MTVWQARLSDTTGARYQRLVQALEEDLATGRVQPGYRLPPQREAADMVGVSVGTVTRAYREAEILGLVESHVGRGTFIRGADPDSPSKTSTTTIDLSLNIPPLTVSMQRLNASLQRLASHQQSAHYLAYLGHEGLSEHRTTIATWLSRRRGIEVSPEHVVICNGAQHAMSLAFAALCSPADTIMCEAATYHGLKPLAAHIHCQLQGLPMDREGLIPDAFEAACRTGQSHVLYTIPTLQNPTARTMGETRRAEIVQIARQHDIWILEDDIYAFLYDTPPTPLATLAPERTLYIDGMSKSLAPGLRFGYLVTPLCHLDAIKRAMRATCWMTSPIIVEMVCELIDSGHMDILGRQLREEARERTRMARVSLMDLMQSEFNTDPAFHFWLPCDALTAERIANRAQQEGVIVTPPTAPLVHTGLSPAETGLRLCIGAPSTRDVLGVALRKLHHAISSIGQEDFSLI